MEQWKDIPGYEGRYQVSDRGRVRSLSRKVGGPHGSTRSVRGVNLTLCPTSQGYSVVNISGVPRFVHSLVMSAFVGSKPEGMDVCHMNGNKADNQLANLQYLSRSENNKHIVHHGNRKLTVDQVKMIRERTYKRGEKRALERELGVSSGMVHAILTSRFYKDV